jgi:hypothetical protein
VTCTIAKNSDPVLTSAASRIESALVKGLDKAFFVAKCAMMDREEKARNSQVRTWIKGPA